jgi:hypothetical protein
VVAYDDERLFCPEKKCHFTRKMWIEIALVFSQNNEKWGDGKGGDPHSFIHHPCSCHFKNEEVLKGKPWESKSFGGIIATDKHCPV